MHELMELKEKLLKELEEYSQNGKFSKEDVETIKYMASAVDHICNIVEAADEEYSQRGMSRYSYNDYPRTGNSYARGRGGNVRRDSMGRYARADGIEELVESVRGMMQELPQNVQQDAQRFVQKLEREM